jgi:multidrug transporter EmrE-like cation transporter
VVFVFLTGLWFFEESMSMQRAGGVALVIVGIALISGRA